MTHTVHFTPEALDQLDKLEVDISGAASPAIAARYVDSIVARTHDDQAAFYYVPLH